MFNKSASFNGIRKIDQISILLILLSSVFSNLIYGILGGPENTFSSLLIFWILAYFTLNSPWLTIRMDYLIFTLFVSSCFVLSVINLNFSESNITGIQHGVQICIKLFIFSVFLSKFSRLNILQTNYILYFFSMTVFYVTLITLPIHILSSYGFELTKARFISMDEADSLRFGGLGFETLDYAYCAMVSIVVILYSKTKYTSKLFILFVLSIGIFFTKSNFITIALAGAIPFLLIKSSKRKKIISFTFLSIILLSILIFEIYDIDFLSFLFLRAANIEEGTSLGERILPGINLMKYYFESFGYLKLPQPGISLSTAINESGYYVTFNAWGLSKILSDFGFFGLFIILYAVRFTSKNLFSANQVGAHDLIFVFSLVYVFAQAGYFNFTAVSLILITARISELNGLYKS